MSAVRHPNVVRFWCVCAVVGYCHIVMELCDQSLMDLLQTPGHDVWNDQFRALFMSRVANQVRRREEKGGEGRRRETPCVLCCCGVWGDVVDAVLCCCGTVWGTVW